MRRRARDFSFFFYTEIIRESLRVKKVQFVQELLLVKVRGIRVFEERSKAGKVLVSNRSAGDCRGFVKLDSSR